jgi:hypothetical protein
MCSLTIYWAAALSSQGAKITSILEDFVCRKENGLFRFEHNFRKFNIPMQIISFVYYNNGILRPGFCCTRKSAIHDH